MDQDFIIPADGWLTLAFNAPTGEHSVEGSAALINITSKIGARSTAVWNATQVFLPVFKGDKISISYQDTGTLIRFRFIYAVGSAPA